MIIVFTVINVLENAQYIILLISMVLLPLVKNVFNVYDAFILVLKKQLISKIKL